MARCSGAVWGSAAEVTGREARQTLVCRIAAHSPSQSLTCNRVSKAIYGHSAESNI